MRILLAGREEEAVKALLERWEKAVANMVVYSRDTTMRTKDEWAIDNDLNDEAVGWKREARCQR